MASAPGRTASSLALSVHGPAGVVDVVVPAGASAGDVAQAYAEQSRLGSLPLLFTRLGAPLPADRSLASVGVEAGDLVVAATSTHRAARIPGAAATEAPAEQSPGFVAGWFCLAAAAATLAGWFGAHSAGATRDATVVVLVLAAALGMVPLGRYAAPRALAAPAFGAAAGLALGWDPHPESLPLVLGIAGLSAAVTAAIARSFEPDSEEGLRVWMVAGLGLFLVGGLSAVLGLSAAVTWSVLLIAAMLAARFVPAFAIDVPDQLLIDLDRLAVTAWSARERPRGRRGRAVASARAVELVARRGARIVSAAGLAIAVVAAAAAALLLTTVDEDPDRIGARTLVFFVGAALLLASRSHRHVVARSTLRLGGLGCWAVLVAQLLEGAGPGMPILVASVSIGLAGVLVVAAVATGRGWRSVWWARRAEVAEGLAGAAALASVLVASGLFRTVWELGSRVAA